MTSPATMPGTADRALPCPRCHHNQRGAAASRPADAPADGTCAECGLRFIWDDVLGDREGHPWWSVEGPSRRAPWPFRIPAQAFMSVLRPRAMVHRLRLEHRARFGRLGLTLAVLPLSLAVVVWGGLIAGLTDGGMPIGTAVRGACQPLSRTPVSIERPVPAAPAGTDVWWDGTAFRLQAAGARSAVAIPYGSVPTGGAGGFDPRFIRWGRPDGAVVRYPVAGGRSLLVDFSVFNGWALGGSGQPGSLFARSLSTSGVVPRYGRTPARVLHLEWSTLGEVIRLTTPAWLVVVTSVIAFSVLPFARRRARVRGRHLVRLTLHAMLFATGWVILAMAIVSVLDLRVARWLSDDGYRRMPFPVGLDRGAEDLLVRTPLLFAPGLACASVWWTWAAGRHLRMARPAAVGLSVATLSTVVLALAFVAMAE